MSAVQHQEALHLASERQLLGMLMRDPAALAKVRGRVRPQQFDQRRHQLIATAALRLDAAAQTVEPLAVAHALEQSGVSADLYGGPGYLLDILEESLATGDVDFHVAAVLEADQRRTLAAAARDFGEALRKKAPISDIAGIANGMLQVVAASTVVEPDAALAKIANDQNAFPVDALPPVVAAFVHAVASAHGVDTAFVAVPALAALAGAVAATRRVAIKVGSWIEPAHLWCGLIASSGAGKSPAQMAVLEPLRRRDKELATRSRLDQETHRAALAAWRAGGGQGPEPVAPPQRQALLDDVTVEAAVCRLVDNPRGLLLAVDELSSFIRSFDKYRAGGGDLSRWLQIHGGGAIRVDRKGSGSAYVERAVVAVVGGIQPSVAKELLGNQAHALSGFTARFLLAAPPTTPALWTDDVVDPTTAKNYRNVCEGLLDLELVDGEPVDVVMAHDARGVFQTWHDELAKASHQAGLAGDEVWASINSKLRGMTARIALVVQLATDAERGHAALTRAVHVDAVQRAIRLARYFQNEAFRIHQTWASSSQGKGKMVEDILTDDWQDRTELFKALHNNISAQELGDELMKLAAAGRAERGKRQGKGRPAELWRRTNKRTNEESPPHQTDQPSPDPRGASDV